MSRADVITDGVCVIYDVHVVEDVGDIKMYILVFAPLELFQPIHRVFHSAYSEQTLSDRHPAK